MAFTRALVSVAVQVQQMGLSASLTSPCQLGNRERSAPLEGERTKSQPLGSEFHFAGSAGKHAAEGNRHSCWQRYGEEDYFRGRSWMKTNPRPG